MEDMFKLHGWFWQLPGLAFKAGSAGLQSCHVMYTATCETVSVRQFMYQMKLCWLTCSHDASISSMICA